MAMFKAGRFFEDFVLGEEIVHATPRTVSDGDVALYIALYGNRFAPQSSRPFAQSLGFVDRPLDDWLVFNLVFGKSVPDISLNAVANLGYAQGIFHTPVFIGDTLLAKSRVIGLKQNSNGETGTVYVETAGFNQAGKCVLRYTRWVMVRKRDVAAPAPAPHVPEFASCVDAASLPGPAGDWSAYDAALAGSATRFDDYAIGDRVDHSDGMMIGDSDHMLATRAYQNTARVHFDAHAQGQSRFGQRLVYGGHVISMVRALSFNGLATGFGIAAINAGVHVGPAFAGDTIYAWSEVCDRADVAGRADVGALRLRHYAFKNRATVDFPTRDTAAEDMVLDLDVWLYVPR